MAASWTFDNGDVFQRDQLHVDTDGGVRAWACGDGVVSCVFHSCVADFADMDAVFSWDGTDERL